jgi:uncharacterized coiled-coil protein SlyX
MSNLRPESRIKSLEQRASDIEASIVELSSDQAEELKAIRQDIKGLEEGMMSSFKELGGYFELTEKGMDQRFNEVKNELRAVTDRLDRQEELLQKILEKLP